MIGESSPGDSGLLEQSMRKWRGFVFRVLVTIGMTASPGCWTETKVPQAAIPTFQGLTLKVGALEDAGLLVGVSAQRGEWVASRHGEISIQEQPLSLQSIGEVDVLVFPAHLLGTLVDAGVLATIPNATVIPPAPDESAEDGEPPKSVDEPKLKDTFHYIDIAPAYRDHVTRYGNERVALPIGGSALVLVYRRDAFERDANVAAAKEKGLKLEAPKTWVELDAVAQFFEGRDWNGDGSPDHGIALVLGEDAEGLGNATYLARAASLGQHPDQFSFLFGADNMTPRIDTTPFVEALQGAIALKASGPPGLDRFDGRAVREAFHSGKVAMLVDRAEFAANWSHGKRLGVAPLPGSQRVFDPTSKSWVTPSGSNTPSYLPRGGGWLAGVRQGLSGSQLEAAIDFIRYLASPESSNRIRSEPAFPMLPFRISQMSQGLPDPTLAADVDSRLWSDAVSRTLLSDRVVAGLRIPGTEGYLEDLAKGRAAALAGEDPHKALEGVARAWAERTKALGRKRQTWHYRRSLNLRGTSPQPPEPGT
jgi:multiple sugar transport system substrate-binding protein